MPVQSLGERLEQLAAVTDEPGIITRTFLSPAMGQANALVGGWMREAGGQVEEDGWGNLIGLFPGTDPNARTLLLGSHLDTVRDAGRYDGPLGVLAALAALEALAEKGVRLPFHVEVLGFSDEEGVRFHSAYLGSKAFTGLVSESDLELHDAKETSVREAVAARQRTKAVAPPQARHAPGQLLGYVEVHIEQGPVLEDLGVAFGVVSHIAAQSRITCTWTGRAGHAGTTPMPMRHDALAGAAEFILAVENAARHTSGLVATVGQLRVEPDVSNVIPARVTHSLDLRHAESAVMQKSTAWLEEEAKAIATRRDLRAGFVRIQGTGPVACAPGLTRGLEEAVARRQNSVPRLVSGSGHDAVIVSRVAPIAMLFVRCRAGLSHHPDEHVTAADLAATVEVLADFLEHFRP